MLLESSDGKSQMNFLAHLIYARKMRIYIHIRACEWILIESLSIIARKSVAKFTHSDSIYMDVKNRQIYADRMWISGCQGWEQVTDGELEEGTPNGYKVSFGGDENVLKLEYSRCCSAL